MQYRRAKAKGGTYFFTVVTYDRRRILCAPDNVALLRTVFKRVMERHPFKIDAFVLLPDHLHCIWTLPHEDRDFSERWRLIKSDFSNYVEYIHYNPVKHRLVQAPKDWEYSSFHRYVREGIYEVEWGAREEITFDFGHMG